MKNFENQTSVESDLLWDAFRYVADEMSADEVDAFEQSLAENQSAREAVVRAVQVTQAVASVAADGVAESVEAVASRTSSSRFVAVALSVCLLLAAGLYVGSGFDSQTAEENTVFNTDGVGDLVAIWSNSENALDEMTDSSLPVTNENKESTSLAMTELAMTDFDDQTADAYDVPGWMLAGVAFQLQDGQLSPKTQLEEK